MDRKRKVVLITGCSSGFGLLLSIRLLKEGYFVIATMRDLSKEQQLLSQIKDPELLVYLDVLELDVINYKQQGKQLTAILDKYPIIDVFINNAGVILSGMIEDLDVSSIVYQYEVNVIACAWLVNQVSKLMIEQNHGQIIIISSLAGRRAMPMQSMYHSSKFALSGLAESLFFELAPYHINVSLVEPGVYRTNVWDNAMIRKAENPTSYKQKMYRYSDRFTNGKNPEEVVNKVTKIIKTKNPKLHYTIGVSNWFFILCKGVIYSRPIKLIYQKFMK